MSQELCKLERFSLQGTSRKLWPNGDVGVNLVMPPKIETLRKLKFLNISMLMYHSLANPEPSTMYLSSTLLQGIIWAHRSRGSIGVLKTTILVLDFLKER